MIKAWMKYLVLAVVSGTISFCGLVYGFPMTREFVYTSSKIGFIALIVVICIPAGMLSVCILFELGVAWYKERKVLKPEGPSVLEKIKTWFGKDGL